MATEDEDIHFPFEKLITYGLKGMAAYARHAMFWASATKMFTPLFRKPSKDHRRFSEIVEDLVAPTLATGEHGVKTMALLDEANTTKYGHPEIASFLGT